MRRRLDVSFIIISSLALCVKSLSLCLVFIFHGELCQRRREVLRTVSKLAAQVILDTCSRDLSGLD